MTSVSHPIVSALSPLIISNSPLGLWTCIIISFLPPMWIIPAFLCSISLAHGIFADNVILNPHGDFPPALFWCSTSTGIAQCSFSGLKPLFSWFCILLGCTRLFNPKDYYSVHHYSKLDRLLYSSSLGVSCFWNWLWGLLLSWRSCVFLNRRSVNTIADFARVRRTVAVC